MVLTRKDVTLHITVMVVLIGLQFHAIYKSIQLENEKIELTKQVGALTQAQLAANKTVCSQNYRISQLQSRLYGIPPLEITPDCQKLLGIKPSK